MRLTITLTLLAGLCSLATDAAAARTLKVHRPTPIPMGANGTTGPPNRATITIEQDFHVVGNDDAAIRKAIEEAAEAGTDGTVAVVLTPGETYTLSNPLTIPSNVILDGTGASIGEDPGPRPKLRLMPRSNGDPWAYAVSMQDASGTGSSNAGLYYVRLEAQTNAQRCVWVRDEASDIYIYDNILVDEVDPDVKGNVETPASATRMVDLEEGAFDVWIDGNQFLHCTTGIKIHQGRTAFVRIFANRFTQWRKFAITANRRENGVLAAHDIIIRNNRINPPKKSVGPRKPIDFQTAPSLLKFPAETSNAASNQPIYRVFIENNLIFGMPGLFYSRYEDNRATADMITAHRVRKLVIRNNKLRNGGEVGINVARGSYDALIQANSVERCDGSGVNVGVLASPEDGVLTNDDLKIDFVRVRDNSLRENNRNANRNVENIPGTPQDLSFPGFARSGVVAQNADRLTVVNNVFRELPSFVKFFSDSTAFRYCETKCILEQRVSQDRLPDSYEVDPSAIPATTLQAISVTDVDDLNVSGNDISGLPDHCVLIEDYPTGCPKTCPDDE